MEQKKNLNVVQLLEEIQEEHGYLPEEELRRLSSEMGINATDIYGVGTFYSFFTFDKPAKFVIKVCDGTACHVRGSHGLMDVVKSKLGIGAGQKTKDNIFALEVVRCLGICASAPLMTINDKLYCKLKKDDVKNILDELRKNEVCRNE